MSGSVTDEEIERARTIVRAGERIVVLTGAGISTDSGIPDFRGPNGRVDEEPRGREDGDDPALPRRPRGPPAGVAAPRRSIRPGRPSRTPGHLAIVELERQGQLAAVVTQNVDGLHQKAGIDPDEVIEVHGTIWFDACWELRRPAADGRDARPGARRRGRSAVPRVRRDPQERHDQLRPERSCPR